jgi:D-glycero-beta-D-manno-heptose-7-phosphate kinase
MNRIDRLLQLIDGFAEKRIAMLGDFVADIFVFGQTKRVSREAPVIVLEFINEKLVLGGAANAVHNVRTLGANPIPIGIIGKDANGNALRKAFLEKGIGTDFIFEVADRVTTAKQRFVGSSIHTSLQQVLRLDKGDREPVDHATEAFLSNAIIAACEYSDILIVSDYDYGVLTDSLIERINGISRRGRVKVMIDSRYRLGNFRHAYVMTPNEPEAEEASGIEIKATENVRRAGRQILSKCEAENVLVTRGRQGMALFEKNGNETLIPIFGSDEISDVTGAGDTVIATFAAATAAGADPLEASVLANVAGGLVVMKSGTATVSAEEIRETILKEDPWPGL